MLLGPDVVAQLRRELAADPELLSQVLNRQSKSESYPKPLFTFQPVLTVQTRVCQNDCGGHGVCDQTTRRCICQVCFGIWVVKFHFHFLISVLHTFYFAACMDGKLCLHLDLGRRE